MRVMLVVVIAATIGCGDMAVRPSPEPMPDGGPIVVIMPPPGCPALPDPSTFPLDLGLCTPDPNPMINVLCGGPQGESGWCEDGGVCRPMVDATPGAPPGCPVCPAGVAHQAVGGAHYCAPS